MTERDILSKGPIGRALIVNTETGKVRRMFEAEDGRKLWLETGEEVNPEELELAKSVTSLGTQTAGPEGTAE